jgi:protein arginine kinase activator
MTRIINGQKTEFHLCSECAQKHQGFNFAFEPSFSIDSLLAGLLNQSKGMGVKPGMVEKEMACPHCGCTFEHFRQNGRVGCSECYTVFSPRMEPILKKIHGSSVHRGKIPRRLGGTAHRRRQISQLRETLNRLIAEEAFEEAAKVRDQIRDMEQAEHLGDE